MSAIATVFSIASALQRLRADEQRPLNPHYPDFHVFDGKNLTLYSEGLLRATILRVVLPKEWGLKVLGEPITKELLAAAQQPNQAVMLGELLLSITRGVLEPSLATALRPLLDTRDPAIFQLVSSGLARL